jgi:hypothetical protein
VVETGREQAFASVPRNWGKNVTLLASMSVEGMGPSLVVEGSTTREVLRPTWNMFWHRPCDLGRWW